jgi:CRP-like cAMP-binding protein
VHGDVKLSAARLTEDELDAIASYGAKASWPANFLIYQRNNPADGIFVVLSGYVALRSRVKSGRGFAAALAGRGESFGAEGLAPDGVYASDARAEVECETLYLSGVRFRAFLREQPQHAVGLIGQVMSEHAANLRRLHEMATSSVEQRILSSVQRLHESGAFTREDGRIALDPPQYRLLCELVGATRESVSVVMGRLVGEGLAEREGTTIVLASMSRLQKRASGDAEREVEVETSREKATPGNQAAT